MPGTEPILDKKAALSLDRKIQSEISLLVYLQRGIQPVFEDLNKSGVEPLIEMEWHRRSATTECGMASTGWDGI